MTTQTNLYIRRLKTPTPIDSSLGEIDAAACCQTAASGKNLFYSS